jgi:hypothetical protein
LNDATERSICNYFGERKRLQLAQVNDATERSICNYFGERKRLQLAQVIIACTYRL